MPFGDELHHSPFLVTKANSVRSLLRQKRGEQGFRNRAAEEGLVLRQRLNGGQELAGQIGLQNVAACPRIQHLRNKPLILVYRKDQNFRVWQASADLPLCLPCIYQR